MGYIIISLCQILIKGKRKMDFENWKKGIKESYYLFGGLYLLFFFFQVLREQQWWIGGGKVTPFFSPLSGFILLYNSYIYFELGYPETWMSTDPYPTNDKMITAIFIFLIRFRLLVEKIKMRVTIIHFINRSALV